MARPIPRGATKSLPSITSPRSSAAAAISEAQGERFAVLGAYHSHPRGGPAPSDTDTAQAFRDFVFVIVGLAGAAGGMEIRAYTFSGETLSPIELIVVDAQS